MVAVTRGQARRNQANNSSVTASNQSKPQNGGTASTATTVAPRRSARIRGSPPNFPLAASSPRHPTKPHTKPRLPRAKAINPRKPVAKRKTVRSETLSKQEGKREREGTEELQEGSKRIRGSAKPQSDSPNVLGPNSPREVAPSPQVQLPDLAPISDNISRTPHGHAPDSHQESPPPPPESPEDYLKALQPLSEATKPAPNMLPEPAALEMGPGADQLESVNSIDVPIPIATEQPPRVQESPVRAELAPVVVAQSPVPARESEVLGAFGQPVSVAEVEQDHPDDLPVNEALTGVLDPASDVGNRENRATSLELRNAAVVTNNSQRGGDPEGHSDISVLLLQDYLTLWPSGQPANQPAPSSPAAPRRSQRNEVPRGDGDLPVTPPRNELPFELPNQLAERRNPLAPIEARNSQQNELAWGNEVDRVPREPIDLVPVVNQEEVGWAAVHAMADRNYEVQYGRRRRSPTRDYNPGEDALPVIPRQHALHFQLPGRSAEQRNPSAPLGDRNNQQNELARANEVHHVLRDDPLPVVDQEQAEWDAIDGMANRDHGVPYGLRRRRPTLEHDPTGNPASNISSPNGPFPQWQRSPTARPMFGPVSSHRLGYGPAARPRHNRAREAATGMHSVGSHTRDEPVAQDEMFYMGGHVSPPPPPPPPVPQAPPVPRVLAPEVPEPIPQEQPMEAELKVHEPIVQVQPVLIVVEQEVLPVPVGVGPLVHLPIGQVERVPVNLDLEVPEPIGEVWSVSMGVEQEDHEPMEQVQSLSVEPEPEVREPIGQVHSVSVEVEPQRRELARQVKPVRRGIEQQVHGPAGQVPPAQKSPVDQSENIRQMRSTLIAIEQDIENKRYGQVQPAQKQEIDDRENGGMQPTRRQTELEPQLREPTRPVQPVRTGIEQQVRRPPGQVQSPRMTAKEETLERVRRSRQILRAAEKKVRGPTGQVPPAPKWTLEQYEQICQMQLKYILNAQDREARKNGRAQPAQKQEINDRENGGMQPTRRQTELEPQLREPTRPVQPVRTGIEQQVRRPPGQVQSPRMTAKEETLERVRHSRQILSAVEKRVRGPTGQVPPAPKLTLEQYEHIFQMQLEYIQIEKDLEARANGRAQPTRKALVAEPDDAENGAEDGGGGVLGADPSIRSLHEVTFSQYGSRYMGAPEEGPAAPSAKNTHDEWKGSDVSKLSFRSNPFSLYDDFAQLSDHTDDSAPHRRTVCDALTEEHLALFKEDKEDRTDRWASTEDVTLADPQTTNRDRQDTSVNVIMTLRAYSEPPAQVEPDMPEAPERIEQREQRFHQWYHVAGRVNTVLNWQRRSDEHNAIHGQIRAYNEQREDAHIPYFQALAAYRREPVGAPYTNVRGLRDDDTQLERGRSMSREPEKKASDPRGSRVEGSGQQKRGKPGRRAASCP